MMRIATAVALLVMTISLQSCFKEDDQVTPHPVGDLQTDTIPMTDTYLNQVYFSLDSGRIVSSNIKTTFDLGFECRKSGWHIILNTSNFMKVVDLGEVTFGAPYDTTGYKLKFDKSDGNIDSTAIDSWFNVAGNDTVSKRHVYAISRGLDEAGNPLGVYQVIFDSLKNNTYYFRYAPLAGGSGSRGYVKKDPQVNFIYFSLKTGSVIAAEPAAPTYDLLFTQYTTLLFTTEGLPYPYLVTGVLLNRFQVAAVADSLTDFMAITRDMARNMTYSNAMDVIGWEWKTYNFDTGVYTIKNHLCFVIRGVSGYYYKLRFTGFYNKDGLKGYPMFEYQRL
ncbi:MAG: HmuY family protein [Bacteroidales bacterium]